MKPPYKSADVIGKVLREKRRPAFVPPAHIVGVVTGKDGMDILVTATWHRRNHYWNHSAMPLDHLNFLMESGRHKITSA